MNAVGAKMQTVKGYGVGREAVMGRLKSITQMRERVQGAGETRDYGWEDFSRAVGISISRVGELCEYIDGIVPSDLRSQLCVMLDFLRSRDFLSEMRDMIDSGIASVAAVEHIEREYGEDASIRETCVLLARILRGEMPDYISEDGTVIAFSQERLDVTSILAAVRAEISGLVCVGDSDSLAVKLADVLGLSALFITDDDIEKCLCGERAILDPERAVLFISPEIEVVDEFTSRINGEKLDEALGIFCGETLYQCFEGATGERCGFLLDMRGNVSLEDDLFLLYRRVAEQAGNGGVTVCIRDAARAYEHLRAVCRAAVYGRFSVAVSARTACEYAGFCEIFSCVCEELTREGREFEDGISCGAVIDSMSAALLSDFLAESADFLLVDTECVTNGMAEKDRLTVVQRLLGLVFSRGESRIKRLGVFGDMCISNQRLEEILSSAPEILQKCFLADRRK